VFSLSRQRSHQVHRVRRPEGNETLPGVRGKGNEVMGLFRPSGNHNIYKDTEKNQGKTPPAPAKSCGMCHGTRQQLNKSGRPTEKRCKSCG
jgi:hypothetical protein